MTNKREPTHKEGRAFTFQNKVTGTKRAIKATSLRDAREKLKQQTALCVAWYNLDGQQWEYVKVNQ